MAKDNKEEGNWLFWIIAFLVIAFFVYVWLTRDEQHEQDADERTANSLREVESKISQMHEKAQSVIHATEERIAKASAKLAKETDKASEDVADRVKDVAEKTKGVAKEVAEKAEDVAENLAEGIEDDLTRIEGIGAKYRDALVEAGVSTFAQVASKTEEELTQIVRDAGMRRPASISTWAEQAKLASQDDWDALNALQDKLKGGRR